MPAAWDGRRLVRKANNHCNIDRIENRDDSAEGVCDRRAAQSNAFEFVALA
jgi:hypothetical protein